MNAAPAYANKKCWQREVEHAQKLHKSKLATIKPTSQTNSKTVLDFERPKTMDMTHVKNKSKKLLVRAVPAVGTREFVLISMGFCRQSSTNWRRSSTRTACCWKRCRRSCGRMWAGLRWSLRRAFD
jgi:hypothetical protein